LWSAGDTRKEKAMSHKATLSFLAYILLTATVPAQVIERGTDPLGQWYSHCARHECASIKVSEPSLLRYETLVSEFAGGKVYIALFDDGDVLVPVFLPYEPYVKSGVLTVSRLKGRWTMGDLAFVGEIQITREGIVMQEGTTMLYPKKLTKEEMADIQDMLNASGFDNGAPDGVIGSRTTAAIKAFETAHGYPPSGLATKALQERLRALTKR
jgi:Putative peptidoglycan binding domain